VSTDHDERPRFLPPRAHEPAVTKCSIPGCPVFLEVGRGPMCPKHEQEHGTD
jgi:hypothetical protein